MKIMQKGSILIFLLMGIFILGVAGGAYYLARSTSSKPPASPTVISQTPQPTPTPFNETANPDSIGANWKTYVNETYKYSLKVPNDWVIDFNNAKENNNSLVFIYSADFKVVGDIQVPHLSQGSQLEIVSNFSTNVTKSYTDFITLDKPPKNEYPNEGKEITIDGEQAMIWTSDNAFSIPGQKGYQLDVLHNRQGYAIHMVSALPQDLLFNQILSTFKFLDQEHPEGKPCGGFAGEQGQSACPSGYKCQYPKPMYPDAQGKCVKK